MQLLHTNKTKKIFYLAGLPRAGNTLLSSILNQNPKVKISANSILATITWDLFCLKDNKVFKNFPDHKSLDNVIKNVFNNFYNHIDAEIIFERSCWGTPANLMILKKYFNPKPNFLILNRPILEIVASFVRSKRNLGENDFLSISRNLFDENHGKLTQDIRSARNIVKNKERHLMIDYDNLVSGTKSSIEKIYEHFNLPKFEHNYDNIEQFTFNNISYDDNVLDFDLHSIRTDGIKKQEIKVEDYLSKEIINKFKDFNIYA